MPAKIASRDWDRWGDENPYFGVLADPKFLTTNLTDESIEEFFDTGKRHVEHVYAMIRSTLQADFQARRVLDFGCGVGRLLVPFNQGSETVVGVDVSSGMLAQARQQCERYGAHSVQLLHGEQLDSLPPRSFDLVHSFIVFQHIPVAQGEVLFRKLVTLVADGGVGAIQFTYSDSRSLIRRAVLKARSRVRLLHVVVNVAQGKPFSWPLMQMNSYSLNRILDIIMGAHCTQLHVELTRHGGFNGAMIYFQKAASTSKGG